MKSNGIDYLYYGRKSSESDERQIQSLDDQERACAKLAASAGLNIIDHLEEAKSAKEPHRRPAFDAMLKLLRSGRAQGIVCWKLDRLSRNPDEAGVIIGMLQRGQIRHIKTSERDYFSDDNTLLTYMEFGIANQAIRDLSKNVKRGLESKVEKGWRPCKAPQGYANTKLAERGTNYIVVDEERFSLIRRAWDLMLTGCYLPREILEILNSQWGFRTRPSRKLGGRPLSLGALYRIFTNPFYAGVIAYAGFEAPGRHTPMITIAEFERVQRLLGKADTPRRTRHTYAFNGILRCGECGGFVSATFKEKYLKTTNEMKAYTLYYCTSSKRGLCSQYYTNSEIIDKQIETRLLTITMPPLLVKWSLAVLAEQSVGQEHTENTIAQTRDKALASAKRELDVLTDLRVREMIDDEEFEAGRGPLRSRIARLRTQQAEASNTEMEVADLTAEDV
ncbi:MAG: recombinase family protein [Hyphomicrobium sp.]